MRMRRHVEVSRGVRDSLMMIEITRIALLSNELVVESHEDELLEVSMKSKVALTVAREAFARLNYLGEQVGSACGCRVGRCFAG